MSFGPHSESGTSRLWSCPGWGQEGRNWLSFAFRKSTSRQPVSVFVFFFFLCRHSKAMKALFSKCISWVGECSWCPGQSLRFSDTWFTWPTLFCPLWHCSGLNAYVTEVKTLSLQVCIFLLLAVDQMDCWRFGLWRTMNVQKRTTNTKTRSGLWQLTQPKIALWLAPVIPPSLSGRFVFCSISVRWH